MKKMKSHDEFLNEARSITKISKELADITSKMKDLATEYYDIRSQGDQVDRIEAIKDELRDLTPKKKALIAELDDSVYYKNINIELDIKESNNESVVTEAKFNFSEDAVKNAAEQLAKAMSNTDKVKVEVHDFEYDKGRGAGFELSWDGDKYDGGSYYIKPNGDVINAAVGGGIKYGTIKSSVRDFEKGIKASFDNNESKVNEAVLDFDTNYDQYHEAMGNMYKILSKQDKKLAREFTKAWQSVDDVLEEFHYTSESELTEKRKIQTKRKYTENHPAKTVGKTAKIRNKILEAIKDGRMTQSEFDRVVKEMSSDHKRWMKRNSNLFNVSEDGISLSKFGQKILKGITVNETVVNESFKSFTDSLNA
jgi:hypothetical protein